MPEDDLKRPRRLGLLVNPVAGLGGPMGEKGSDAPDIAARAEAAGRAGQAGARAARALAAFRRASEAPILAGPLPPETRAALDGEVETLDLGPTAQGRAETLAAVAAMAERVDLILFAGGDGTARDVAEANRAGLPVIGIPAGVKMHSGVFARSPERAGRIAAEFLAARTPRTDLVEILDIDEEARRAGQLSARIYSVARTPATRGERQNPKAGGGDMLADLDAALAGYVAGMVEETLYILGPGTTMAALKARIGGGTLLGVDLAEGPRITARDLSEDDLLERIPPGRPVRVVLTVVGGQGFVLGRGNQQISARVLERAGRPPIDVVCSAEKLAGLTPPELTIDTGDPALDAQLSGYWPITTGPGRKQVVRVVA
ncbi:NAD(+)/NADH kinase [Roseivivax sp. GX 12232]|uniref:ATP-NAD kinase family protein n=1 Tax=Roseivivax sp. GX 12232 TaxID=2900547 RepID=UPI001E62AB41|nr:NAD(+)/NADH kinase [Roseivivax sp. GX 12232]MCE0504010.1 NAD(+)/NADH kinase [Roseivivax sp. GX 12232]